MLELVPTWAETCPDVVAAGLADSWARSEARMDSDVDLVILTREPRGYIQGETWIQTLGGLRIVRTQAWGQMTERRFILSSGLEVEAGIVPPSWAATDPVDPELPPIIRDGFRILYDPEQRLARLLEACL